MALLRLRSRTRLAYLGTNYAGLSTHLGMSRQAMQGWLTRPSIKLENAQKVASALGVPLSFLVEPGVGFWAHLTSAPPKWVEGMCEVPDA